MANQYNVGVPSIDDDEEWPMNKSGQSGQWSTGLFDCFHDCRLCCLTYWCPCITFGRIAEFVNRGSTSCGASGVLYCLIMAFTGCQCVYSSIYRTKTRDLYGLPEGPCPDFLVHCCCERCALCQVYRELRSRGFDMNMGYHENVRRMGEGVEMSVPPSVPGGMYR